MVQWQQSPLIRGQVSRREGRGLVKHHRREGRGLVRHHCWGLGASGANVLNVGDPTWRDIARLRLQEPYGVIAVGGKDTLLCTAVRGRGRETSRGKLQRQQLSIPKSEGAYCPAHNRGSGGGESSADIGQYGVHDHNG